MHCISRSCNFVITLPQKRCHASIVSFGKSSQLQQQMKDVSATTKPTNHTGANSTKIAQNGPETSDTAQEWSHKVTRFHEQLAGDTQDVFSIHQSVASLTRRLTNLMESECNKVHIDKQHSPLKGLSEVRLKRSAPSDESVLKKEVTELVRVEPIRKSQENCLSYKHIIGLKPSSSVKITSAHILAVQKPASAADIMHKTLKERDYQVNTDTSQVKERTHTIPGLSHDTEESSVKLKRDKKAAKLAKETVIQEQLRMQRMESRINAFNIDLKSYIDACISSNMLNRAETVLLHYKKLNKRKGADGKYQIRDVDIYATIMRAWAKHGNSEKVMSLLNALRKSGLVPNVQIYSACLESLARQPVFDHSKAMGVIDDLKSQGHVIEDLFNQCSFVRDESYAVLQAITTIIPDYKPSPAQLTLYSNPLLSQLSSAGSQINPYYGVTTTDKLREQSRKQLHLELQTEIKVPSIQALKPPSPDSARMKAKLEAMITECRNSVTNAFNSNLKQLEDKNGDSHRLNIVPYLKLFEPSVYVNIIVDELLDIARHCENYSPPVTHLSWGLGCRVRHKYVTKDKIDNHISDRVMSVYSDYTRVLSAPTLPLSNHRLSWQDLCKHRHHGPNLDGDYRTIPSYTLRAVGKFLFQTLLSGAKFDANMMKKTNERNEVPALFTVHRYHGKMQKEEVKPHPILVTLSKSMLRTHLTFGIDEMPMLVPPIPWQTVHNGGFLLTSTKLVRLPDTAHEQFRLLEATKQEEINPVLDSLNALSACPWLINKPVLDIIMKVFNDKGDKSLGVAPPPTEAPPWPKLTKEMSTEERIAVYRERLRVKQRRSEMYSLWCSDLYRLSIANMYRDEIFWFPHNLDFRSRAYPSPPHFNHLGNDTIRGILVFAKGKALGEKGFDWLKIHLINLTGLRKRDSNAARLDYANEIMPDILDSADYSLTGRGWWKLSDEPWQTLACCMEIAKAERSPDPSQYVCHFPIHQDGSCNGLQHYAALGRDQGGAQSVNLAPFSTPNDVYSDIAELVERERKLDADCGVEVAQALDGFIGRKVIKQTIMTTVYGVTKYGAKLQILRQLRDIAAFPHEHDVTASMYLATKAFFCLQEKFTATKAIQDWFTNCAYLISKHLQQPMQWVTPLGFPIVQPYHKTVTSSKAGVQTVNTYDMFQKPNSMKQKNAFPPNYIHSLDSTHMMLTALYSMRAGISYVSVHDCFWTHPCDVDVMNRITREQFVSLHQLPLLEHLSRYMLATYIVPQAEECKFIESLIKQVPQTGSFDIANVLKSTYFFS